MQELPKSELVHAVLIEELSPPHDEPAILGVSSSSDACLGRSVRFVQGHRRRVFKTSGSVNAFFSAEHALCSFPP